MLKTLLKNSKNMQKTLFKPKPLTVPFVFSNLKEIALSAGHSVNYTIIRPLVHSNVCPSHKAKKCRLLQSFLPRVRAKRQSILSGA